MKSSVLALPLLLAMAATAAGAAQTLPPIEYVNKGTPGPQIIVMPGEIKSSSTEFKSRFTGENIADFAELELGNANFRVLERSDLGPVLKEVQTAYTLGDPDQVKKVLQKGRLKTTKYFIRFDVLKAELTEAKKSGVDLGTTARTVTGFLPWSRNTSAANNVADSIKTDSAQGTWLIGMRYKIIDANTTEQVASGYHEETLETGGGSSSALGFSGGKSKPLTLDSIVQRLIQENVADIDAKNK